MNARSVALRLVVMMAVAGGVVAFGSAGAADAVPITTYVCPSTDDAGYPLGSSNTTDGTLFCSYPAVPGENPNDFFCDYSATTGDLTQDGDAGFCPTDAIASQITKVTPSIGTAQQPGTATVGGSIADQATVTGGDSPTGTVTFDLYSNSTATGTPLFTDADVPLSGGVATSSGYTTTATGTDYWVATYNGDANNSSVTSSASAEPVTITPATPSISTTQQPGTATVGSSIADQATVTDGLNPTGTVTFDLYSNSTATGTPLFTDANVALSGGVATSSGYTTTATGTDYWVATYNGDANNSSVTSSASAEPVTITPAMGMGAPSISTTQQPATANVGSSIADQATVTGLMAASSSDTVTFNLYSSATTQNSSTLLFSDTQTVSLGDSDAAASSTPYTATVAGTDYWVATYNGDADNSPVTSSASGEPVTITKATPSIGTTQQPASATVGSSVADKATVTGGYTPTGTVTFNLYSNSTATGTPLFTDADVAISGGVATSSGYTTTTAGTDYWVATYNGDANNSSVTSSASAEPVTITKATTSLKAAPQLVLFEPFVGIGNQVVQATLTSGGSPLVGQTVYFSDGAVQLCHANTNSKGIARCTISSLDQALVNRNNQYTATFTATTSYLGSTSTVPAITLFF